MECTVGECSDRSLYELFHQGQHVGNYCGTHRSQMFQDMAEIDFERHAERPTLELVRMS